MRQETAKKGTVSVPFLVLVLVVVVLGAAVATPKLRHHTKVMVTVTFTPAIRTATSVNILYTTVDGPHTSRANRSPWTTIVEVSPGTEVAVQAIQREPGTLTCYLNKVGDALGQLATNTVTIQGAANCRATV